MPTLHFLCKDFPKLPEVTQVRCLFKTDFSVASDNLIKEEHFINNLRLNFFFSFQDIK